MALGNFKYDQNYIFKLIFLNNFIMIFFYDIAQLIAFFAGLLTISSIFDKHLRRIGKKSWLKDLINKKHINWIYDFSYNFSFILESKFGRNLFSIKIFFYATLFSLIGTLSIFFLQAILFDPHHFFYLTLNEAITEIFHPKSKEALEQVVGPLKWFNPRPTSTTFFNMLFLYLFISITTDIISFILFKRSLRNIIDHSSPYLYVFLNVSIPPLIFLILQNTMFTLKEMDYALSQEAQSFWLGQLSMIKAAIFDFGPYTISSSHLPDIYIPAIPSSVFFYSSFFWCLLFCIYSTAITIGIGLSIKLHKILDFFLYHNIISHKRPFSSLVILFMILFIPFFILIDILIKI